MNKKTSASKFFVAGGTLRPDAPSYVKRPTDEELFNLVLNGKFCYVLTGRQMGKSSLMARTAVRVKEQGVSTVIIDLTQIGPVPVEQWYLGLLTRLKRQLRLPIDPEAWWQERAALGPVQRFTDFLREVVLTEIKGQVVIFIDEIDTTRKLDFTDDFFAAIRYTYNARADDPEFKRLTFVLLGVATPADLIEDRTRTPFNIGQGIVLKEFRQAEAAVLQAGLEKAHPSQGEAIFKRIYHWTNGHPYLTQKLCLAVAEREDHIWRDWQVDQLVETLFLVDETRKESNLQSVHEDVLDRPNRCRLLTIYHRVLLDQEVLDDERSQDKNTLKLLGLVKSENGLLKVPNEIYRQVFDLDWIKANTPVNWTRRVAIVASLVALILALTLSGYIWWQGEAPARAYEEHFTNTTNPTLRLNALANLFALPEYGSRARALLGLPGYDDRARALFDSLTLDEKTELFTNVTPDVQPQVRQVVRGTYTYLADTEANNRLLRAMQAVLDQSDEAESIILANEIARWLDGRVATTVEDAKIAYNAAIDLNDGNPTTYFERALILASLGDNEGALADFETVLSLTKDWQEQMRQAVESNSQLYTTLWSKREAYPALVALVPTPTPMPTSTPKPTLNPNILYSTPTLSVPDLSHIDIPVLTPDLSYINIDIPVIAPDLSHINIDIPVIAPDLSHINIVDIPVLTPDLSHINIDIPVLAPDLSHINISESTLDFRHVSIPTTTAIDEPTPNFSLPP